ncbi:MAG: efflux RND transporter periplasmic adaptor subunit [Vicinamibacterales bacterium]
MRKVIVLLVVLAGAAAGFMFYNRADGQSAQEAGTPGAGGAGRQGGPGGARAGGAGGQGGGAFARPPLTVEVARVSRQPITESLLVVGNLIGQATVEVASRVNGRLQSVNVQLGDSVRRGQLLATVEDSEIVEQVKQAEASNQVSAATVRQREADLKFAQTSLDRSRNLYERQLIPRQTLDDAEARYQAATAQLDLAKAQYEQAKARLEELRITRANTRILSPVDGFVGKRHLDPGAFASPNSTVLSVVDIRVVRLVVNLVEKDLRRVNVGAPARAEVDAFPGEFFGGRVARVAPVLDPATRTAEMEIELPNAAFRLKPGMYARVNLTTAQHDSALVVPRNAVVDESGTTGVFLYDAEGSAARFQKVTSGLNDDRYIEILEGLEGDETVITTGASSLNDGDPVLLPAGGGRGGRGGRGGQGGPAASGPAADRTPAAAGAAAPDGQLGGARRQRPGGGAPGEGGAGGARASQRPGPQGQAQ